MAPDRPQPPAIDASMRLKTTELCGLVAAVAGPLAEIVIVELEPARYAESADSLFGVALWLPALYFAFGVVAATLAELLVAARPSSATKSGSSSPE